jgi:plasmid stability protein
MSTLQVRNVPDEVHRTLKARASRAGQSLSDYVLVELARVAARPTLEELSERIEQRGRVSLPTDVVDILDRERAGRMASIDVGGQAL